MNKFQLFGKNIWFSVVNLVATVYSFSYFIFVNFIALNVTFFFFFSDFNGQILKYIHHVCNFIFFLDKNSVLKIHAFDVNYNENRVKVTGKKCHKYNSFLFWELFIKSNKLLLLSTILFNIFIQVFYIEFFYILYCMF